MPFLKLTPVLERVALIRLKSNPDKQKKEKLMFTFNETSCSFYVGIRLEADAKTICNTALGTAFEFIRKQDLKVRNKYSVYVRFQNSALAIAKTVSRN